MHGVLLERTSYIQLGTACVIVQAYCTYIGHSEIVEINVIVSEWIVQLNGHGLQPHESISQNENHDAMCIHVTAIRQQGKRDRKDI